MALPEDMRKDWLLLEIRNQGTERLVLFALHVHSN
jgi:hypothetical protein